MLCQTSCWHSNKSGHPVYVMEKNQCYLCRYQTWATYLVLEKLVLERLLPGVSAGALEAHLVVRVVLGHTPDLLVVISPAESVWVVELSSLKFSNSTNLSLLWLWWKTYMSKIMLYTSHPYLASALSPSGYSLPHIGYNFSRSSLVSSVPNWEIIVIQYLQTFCPPHAFRQDF